MDFTQIENHIASMMKPARFTHTLGTARQSRQLALRFGLSPDDAVLAALWHDAARDWSDNALQAKVEPLHEQVLDIELRNPPLLHSIVSAQLFSEHEESQYLAPDRRQSIWKAVRWHTLGHPDMGRLAYTVFIADFCEPGRTHLTDQERQRILAPSSLEKIMLLVLQKQLDHFQQQEVSDVSPTTRALYTKLEKDCWE
ncbi:MAG: bis(5'-nucleosyl)-tetraphosphatase (symmetrical) YqeK [Spirochaetota bacterium]